MNTTVKDKEAAAIGARIKKRREELGLSQRDVETDGVTFAYISRIENGDRTPSISALIKIAEKLHVTALYLLTGKTDICPLCGRTP